jgi:hypothetical protein
MDAGLDAQFGTAGLQQTAAQNSASTRKSARPGELFFMISHMLAPLRYSVFIEVRDDRPCGIVGRRPH